MKIIGLMLTWNNLEFFKCSLPQALDFCDELILVEGCHSRQYPQRSDDGTVAFIQSIKTRPKLRIMDFGFGGRYDAVQRRIRSEFPKASKFYKSGNWIMHWDDDMFFMEEDLPKLKTAMKTTDCDSLSYFARDFIYNFRFNSIEKGGVDTYRIIDGMQLSGVSNAHYKNGSYRRFTVQCINEITLFHYSYVKKPERMNARFVMSIEKGTRESVGKHNLWMSVKWEKDEDIIKSTATMESIRPDEEFGIYYGEHPQAVADHPWRYIKDVRSVK